MKRGLLALLALLASGCAFSSEEAFFTANDAAAPIADGARYQWIERGAPDDRAIEFQRMGIGYDVTRVGKGDERPMRVLFIPIRNTREEDYIVQAQLGDGGVAYAFAWRRGDGFRLVMNLSAFATPPDVEGLCEPKMYGECAFASRAALTRFYRRVVRPAFLRKGAPAPAEYLDLVPETEAARQGRR